MNFFTNIPTYNARLLLSFGIFYPVLVRSSNRAAPHDKHRAGVSKENGLVTIVSEPIPVSDFALSGASDGAAKVFELKILLDPVFRAFPA